ncbi:MULTISPECIES: TonB-dependent receptor [Dyella]|uniref:TonB-dependent receptor n=2 Tax=Dyella TaxID=231454 RepID=A0A4R0YLB1_9GAMM|nr:MULTISPECIES: TonB-dependent receptor [Dyella]TBR36691.1 TonB-dependent receptor [Dyella terrae]TCI08218.1 TonB-dependent receptor [Dyella soli]
MRPGKAWTIPALTLGLLVSTGAMADDTTLPAVQVNATRLDIPPFDLPASLSVIRVAPGASSKPGVNLSEALVGVPGILARDRQNYAQDEQVSLRGFGARSTFGVRGVRLYADGIPATMPDGQGQASHFSLDGADRIEVLRGPFSALYGNASGGVMQIWSAEGGTPAQVRVGLFAGSDASMRMGASARGMQGAFDYNLALSHFQTQGYRDHSRAQRESGNARLGFDLGSAGHLIVVANTLALPQAQDPLGLTRSQAWADPRQAAAPAYQFDTRKSVHQSQLGAVYEVSSSEQTQWRLMAYYGNRGVQQVLPVPVAAQRNPLSAGGVVDLDSDYGGVDARWTHRATLLGRPVELTAGASYDDQDQHRRGYENFAGSTLGVTGRLRRDEDDRVWNLDPYAQLYWRFAERWSALVGVRQSTVRFRSDDRYVTADNPDDSGSVRYRATLPVAGVQFRATDWLHLHASFGKGFETPTFAELSYRADGGAGLAFNLRPAVSQQGELGAKWHAAGSWSVDGALFRADTRNELAVASNVGGRASYRTIGRSRREGAEFAAQGELGPGWRLQLAATHVRARFLSPFLTCVPAGCTTPATPVAAGARIPGVPANYGSARLEHGGSLGWRVGVELQGVDAVTVNDLGRERAPGYLLTGVDLAYALPLGPSRLTLSARVDNLFDRRVIGSVIVNEGNGRYYEPAPGRTLMFGAQLAF